MRDLRAPLKDRPGRRRRSSRPGPGRLNARQYLGLTGDGSQRRGRAIDPRLPRRSPPAERVAPASSREARRRLKIPDSAVGTVGLLTGRVAAVRNPSLHTARRWPGPRPGSCGRPARAGVIAGVTGPLPPANSSHEALVRRLVRLRDPGGLRAGHVRAASRAGGVTVRTMWRRVAAGAPARRRVGIDDLRSSAIANASGCWRCAVTSPRRTVDSSRTGSRWGRSAFRRRVARDMTAGERTHALSGVEGRRAHDVYLRWEPEHRGQVHEADHKQFPIEVLAPRAQPPQRPLVIDAFSRLMVGWASSVQPTQAEVTLHKPWPPAPAVREDTCARNDLAV